MRLNRRSFLGAVGAVCAAPLALLGRRRGVEEILVEGKWRPALTGGTGFQTFTLEEEVGRDVNRAWDVAESRIDYVLGSSSPVDMEQLLLDQALITAARTCDEEHRRLIWGTGKGVPKGILNSHLPDAYRDRLRGIG